MQVIFVNDLLILKILCWVFSAELNAHKRLISSFMGRLKINTIHGKLFLEIFLKYFLKRDSEKLSSVR